MVENISGYSRSKQLNNIGFPGSRRRSLSINSNFMDNHQMAEEVTVVSLLLPHDITNVEKWLIAQTSKMGCHTITEAEKKLTLPGDKLLVSRSNDDLVDGSLSIVDTVRNALILARCNDCFYMPGSPFIFTRKRLDRSLQLIKVNIKNYYDLD